jgi:Protein of unknown function (DUF2800)
MAHALLSPSGASRWLACTPSARLEESFASTTNAAAEEGTLAHALSELYLNNQLKKIKVIDFNRELKKIKHNTLFNAEMDGHAMDYAAFILDKVHELGDGAMVEIEAVIDLQEFVPEGFGTVDCKIIANNILEINDLKYGKGVLVEAHENKQMMLYALGALKEAMLMYTIEIVRMTIYQPRLNNFSTFEMEAKMLLQWGEEIVIPAAKLAFEGKGEYKPGSHCRFCKARNQCKALADYNMGMAKFVFEDPNKLKDNDIAEILEKAPDFLIWLGNIKDYALHEAVNNSKKWPGFKLVAGRSNRVYSDSEKIVEALKKAKIKPELFLTEPKLVGIGALEKNIGKPDVEKYAGKFIIKPEGAPTLAPEWDKRPELNSADAAAIAFEEITDL